MYQCKLSKHTWTHAEDAEKCCNGFRRILNVGRAATGQAHARYEEATLVTNSWMRVEESVHDATFVAKVRD